MDLSIATDIKLSLLRWLIGLSLGVLISILLAIINHIVFKKIKIISLLIDFFRAIPIIGLIPFVQTYLGINEYSKIILIAWGVTFPVTITINNSLNVILPNAELRLKGLNFDRINILKYYIIPKLTIGLIKGIDIGIGIAWLCVVAAEWIGTYSNGFWSGGLGYRLTVSYERNEWTLLNSCLIIFGFLGLITSYIWKKGLNYLFSKNNIFNPMQNILRN